MNRSPIELLFGCEAEVRKLGVGGSLSSNQNDGRKDSSVSCLSNQNN